MTELQEKMYGILADNQRNSAEDIVRFFTNCFGNQILSEQLAEWMIEEGMCESWELYEEEN
jgi:hypothetical protein